MLTILCKHWKPKQDFLSKKLCDGLYLERISFNYRNILVIILQNSYSGFDYISLSGGASQSITFRISLSFFMENARTKPTAQNAQ